MALHKITTPGLAINTYVVWDPKTKKTAIIDPTRDVNPVLKFVEDEELHITSILETHVHADFVSGSKELKYRLSNQPAIFSSGLGGDAWITDYADFIVDDKQNIILGGVRLQAWHTPGHTPEHLTWVVFDDETGHGVPLAALTGDFLFIGSIGRPDLLGEKQVQQLAEQLYNSVFEILPELPDSTEIHPAHGAGSLCGKSISKEASSTLGAERLSNPYLKAQPKDQWIQNVLKGMPKAPAYFPLMKEVNVAGAPLLSELPGVKVLDLKNLVKMQSEGATVLDVRSKEEFAKSHIKNAIHIEAVSLLPWAPELIPYDKPIAVIAKDAVSLDLAITKMRLVGLDDQDGYFMWTDDLVNKGKGVAMFASFPLVPTDELSGKMKKGGVTVLDVRAAHEWEGGHIPGAIHVDLRDLKQNLNKIPKKGPGGIVCVCGRGSRASSAASILQQAGFEGVATLEGGMTEWKKLQMPVEI